MDEIFSPLFMSTPIPAGEKTSKIPKIATKGDKTKILELICEGIKVVGVGRKGASYKSIKKYVRSKYDKEYKALNARIKRTFLKAVEDEVLARPVGSKKTGVTGYFKLGNKSKDVSKKHSRAQVSDRTLKKGEKLNLSDTTLLDMKLENKLGKPKVVVTKTVSAKNTTDILTKVVVAKESEIVENKKRTIKESKNVKNDGKAKVVPKNTEIMNKPTKVANTKKVNVKNKDKQIEMSAAKNPVNAKNDKAKPKKKKIKGSGIRNGASDSEFVVKMPNRKSLKSYPLDTEIEKVSMDKTETFMHVLKKREPKVVSHGSQDIP